MRVKFSDLFSVQGGQIAPRQVVSIGGVTMSPGVSFGGGVSFSGVNLSQLIGKDLDVIYHPNGVAEIVGYFN